MHVYEYKTSKGETRYAVHVYLGVNPHTGKKQNTTRRGFKKKSDAKSAGKKLILEYDQSYKFSSTKKFEELYQLWIESYAPTVRESTLVKTKQVFKDHILPFFGEKQLSKIYSADCQRLYNELTTRYTKGRMMYSYARRCYQYAIVPLRLVNENPFDFIEKTARKKKEKKLEKSFMEVEEMKKLLQLIEQDFDNKTWYVFFSLLGYTGLRKSEALALTWNDIDFKEKTLTVDKSLTRGEDYKQILDRPKTYESYRKIFIDDNLISILKEWKRSKGKVTPITTNNLVFPNSKGNYIQNTAPDKPLSKIITQHELKKVTPHSFRHSHCCHLFDAGISIKEVMDRLGHKDIKITMEIYNHVTEFRKKDTLSKYQEYLKSIS